jgi:hypothetical protein
MRIDSRPLLTFREKAGCFSLMQDEEPFFRVRERGGGGRERERQREREREKWAGQATPYKQSHHSRGH